MILADEDELRLAVGRQAGLMGFHVSNIESHLTSAGIPDTNLGLGHIDIWLELKAFGPKRPMKIRPTQRRWHRDRHDAKGQSWFAILDLESQDIFLVPGSSIMYVGSGLTRQWQEGMVRFKPETIDQMIAYMFNEAVKRRAAYVREQKSNSNTASNDPGSAGNPLPEGGQSVGEHHWLLNKP